LLQENFPLKHDLWKGANRDETCRDKRNGCGSG
jgi:hypothetical protein